MGTHISNNPLDDNAEENNTYSLTENENNMNKEDLIQKYFPNGILVGVRQETDKDYKDLRWFSESKEIQEALKSAFEIDKIQCFVNSPLSKWTGNETVFKLMEILQQGYSYYVELHYVSPEMGSSKKVIYGHYDKIMYLLDRYYAKYNPYSKEGFFVRMLLIYDNSQSTSDLGQFKKYL